MNAYYGLMLQDTFFDMRKVRKMKKEEEEEELDIVKWSVSMKKAKIATSEWISLGIFCSNPKPELFEAYQRAVDIEDCFHEHGVKMKIRKKGYDPRCGDGFRFLVILKGKTRVEQIDKLIPTVRLKLKLPNLRSISENGCFFLVTYTEQPRMLNNDLSRVLDSEKYKSIAKEMKLAHPVGIDADGIPMICDLVEYPHAMVSGTTRSGKSTALKCLLLTLARHSPELVNLLIADRGSELSQFANLPHLSYQIIYEPETLAYVFLLLHDEMERRNILKRKDQLSFSKIPYIVFVIDEFPYFIDIINRNKKYSNVINVINDILRYGRHSKIHLVLSIHDPKDEIAIIEKGDIPVGLAFKTANVHKSMNALGGTGAENFSGKGEMNFRYNGKTYHLQGVNLVDDKIELEVQNIIQTYSDYEYLQDEYKFCIADDDLAVLKENNITTYAPFVKDISNNEEEQGRKFAYTTLWVLSQSSVSVNLIQKGCSIGNKNAQAFFDRLQSYGVIGDSAEKGRRTVNIQSIEDMPCELMKILSRYGISDEKVIDSIKKRV